MAIPIVATIGGILIAILIGLDIWFAADNISGNTWSEIIRKLSLTTSIIPFALGVLSGHFLWEPALKPYVPVLGQPNSLALMIWAGLAVGMLGFVFVRAGWYFPLSVSFLLGYVGGMLLWPVGRW